MLDELNFCRRVKAVDVHIFMNVYRHISLFIILHLQCTFLCPAPIAGALSDDARLTSVSLMSVSVCRVHRAKSRTERPRKPKIGTEVAHVTCDSDTTFKVKRSKVNLQGRGHIVAASHTACLNLNTFSCLSVLTTCCLKDAL